jgi:uncharacterized protein (TIGR00297 family)
MSLSALDQDPARWLAGALAAAIIAALAWRLRSLAVSGALAATITGTVLVGCGGWWGGVLLVTFFVSSSALSRTGRPAPNTPGQTRGNRRDAVQVLANGGVAAACAIVLAITRNGVWAVALAAALAAANADTWATELGRLSGARPRSIVTFRQVPAGTSGGVSFPGTIASLAGAALMGIVAVAGWNNAWLALPDPGDNLARLLMIVVGCGFAGSLADSVLGATLQARYRCPACGETTESSVHRCGTPTVLVRGIRWVTNDVVNITAIGLATALALWLAIGGR